jgi:Flp pilus assembly pilin Flp
MFLRNGHAGARLGLPTRGERRAAAVEHGLRVGFVALVIIRGVTASAVSVKGLFELIAAKSPQLRCEVLW